MLSPPRNEIQQFWSWFRSVSDDLANDHENEELLSRLDSHVSKLGDVTWEIGPSEVTESFLSISPDGDSSLLAVAGRIIDFAPRLSRWEFVIGRPARGCIDFCIEGEDGAEVDVRCREWRYVLFRLPSGHFDIVVQQTGFDSPDVDLRHMAATLALDFVLGEESRLLYVRDIECVDSFESDHVSKASDFIVLSEHMESLLND